MARKAYVVPSAPDHRAGVRTTVESTSKREADGGHDVARDDEENRVRMNDEHGGRGSRKRGSRSSQRWEPAVARGSIPGWRVNCPSRSSVIGLLVWTAG